MTKRRDVLRTSGAVLGLAAAGGIATGSTGAEGDGQPLELLPAGASVAGDYRLLLRVAAGDLEEDAYLGPGSHVIGDVDGLERSAVDAFGVGHLRSGNYQVGVVVGSFDGLEPGERTDTAGDWRLADDGERAFATADGKLVFVEGGDGRGDVAAAAVAAARGETDDALDDVGHAATTYERLSDEVFVYHLVFDDSRSAPSGTEDLAAFGAGFDAAPGRNEASTENVYLLYPEADTEIDDEQAKAIARELDPGRVTSTEVTREDGVLTVTATSRQPPEYDRDAAPEARVESTVDHAAGTVAFEHQGGEPVDAANLQLWHDGELGDAQPSDEFAEFGEGDRFVVETDPLASLTLRWYDETENVQYVYDALAVGRTAFETDHDFDAGTVEFRYVGERPADPAKLRVQHYGEDGRESTPQFADEYDELTAGDALTVEDVSIGDRLRLRLDVPEPPTRSRRTLARVQVDPPRVYLHRDHEHGLILHYHDEQARDAEEFRLLVDGEPADTQPADVADTFERGDDVELGDPPLGSEVTLQWLEPDEPVTVAREVVAPDVDADFEYDDAAGELTVVHDGGDAVSAADLTLRVGGEPDEGFASAHDEFGPDDEYTTTVDPFDVVELVWPGPGDREHVLDGTVTGQGTLQATYDPDAATVELTYVGEQPADPGRLGVRVWRRGDGEHSGPEPLFAADHDTLTAGDSVTIESVDPRDRLIVVVLPDEEGREHRRHHRHVLSYTPAPRHAFAFESRDGEVVATYRSEIERDAAAFRVLADGEPAGVQPADQYETLSKGDEVVLGSLAAGTELVVQWTVADEPVVVADHTVVPDAEFEVSYDVETVTVEHVGGEGIPADDIDIFVRPGTDGPVGWDGEGTVTEGDTTTVSVDREPEVVYVVYRREELLHEAELGD